ncbi:MAG: ATP-grasp domain-containing protein [Myxococcales bacterium]|nr:ATP-grasp domain-containing protein [Myxococcales bacterium]
MFRRILIANRGEVAARVLRTCTRLGVEVVAVASDADREASWLADATEVVSIGASRAQRSYLDSSALIEAALHHRCSAVHPGWGFLSENEAFATQCAAAGLTFVGPDPVHLRLMGDKAAARSTMARLGLPVIPGTRRPLGSLQEARAAAEEVGFPILLKAVSGGGGRGMRRVDDPSELEAAFSEAQAEATASFGDGRLYLERRIVGGRHVEVQVVGDRFGNAVHLGERECSLQRRHQKVLEEAPSPALSAAQRQQTLPLVAEVVARSGYRNAGTVEMLLDADDNLWFMEMNTRLQVEHPVSEATTGIDLVEWQLRIAANEPLPCTQEEIAHTGHALECRINAEDPDNGFRPSPGILGVFELPEADGVRVDTHLRAGDRIPPDYDSMIAKVIVHAADRASAIEAMGKALQRIRIEGVTTNVALHQRILQWDAFRSGIYDTTSLESWMA